MTWHTLCSMCIWSPHSTSSPLLEGQSGPAVKRRVSGPKDAALTRSQNKIVSFWISLCPTVPEETNPKQLQFSLCLQNVTAEMSWWIERDQTGFWHKMNKKDPSWGSLWNTPVTYSHLPDQQFEGDFVWLETSWVCLLVIIRRGFIGTILLKGWLKNNAKTPSHFLLFQLSSFQLCSEKFLLQSFSLLHLLYFILNCSFCLTQFVPKLPYSSTQRL